MPPEVVSQGLGTPVQFPCAQGLESIVVNSENSAGRATLSGTDTVEVYGIGPTVDSMQPTLTGTVGNYVGFHRLDYLRTEGVRLGINYVDP